MASVAPVIYLHIIIFIIAEMGHGTKSGIKAPGATAPGDIIIAGLFPIHRHGEKNLPPCEELNLKGLTKCLAMINWIETLNKSPLLADVNITLGYRIYDSCSNVSTALWATADIAPLQEPSVCGGNSTKQPVMAVIGAAYSDISIAVARQLTLNMVPQISYSSTAISLSDKERFPAFMRTVPNDKSQTAAMVQLMMKNNWNWVGIVIEDGDYGHSALDSFVTQATKNGICVAFKLIIPKSSQDECKEIKKAAKTILDNHKVKAIVSFAKPSHMEQIYRQLKAEELERKGQNMSSMKRVWVASDSWSSSNYVPGNLTLDDIGHIVGFTFKTGNTSSFDEYLRRLGAVGHSDIGSNTFLKELYQKYNGTSGSGDQSGVAEKLKNYTDADTTLSIEMAVTAIAQAVASLCQSRDCKTPGSLQTSEVLEALRNMSFDLRGEPFKFDNSGDVNMGYDIVMWRTHKGSIDVNDIVAKYHPTSNTLNFTNTKLSSALKDIVSKCSDSCVAGQSKKTGEGQHTCCYECINCTENYYSNGTDMDQCLSCNTSTEYSFQGSDKCTQKKPVYFSWKDGFSVVLVVFSALGIVLALLVSALFLHWRETPVVRAAGGPLSQVILFSLVASFIGAMLFIGKPYSLRCQARQVLYGMSFTLCVSCILVKSLRILMAFQFNPELQAVLRRRFKPYLIIIACMAIQAVICICWLVIKSPFEKTLNQPHTLLVVCDEGSNIAFGLMLGYIAVLAFVCFICAFMGRKLPQNYNEAKFITFSMLLYLTSWMLFIPIYVTQQGKYLDAVEIVVILISNYGILCCHFFPKCYVIIFKKERNTKSAFRKNIYEYSNKTTLSESRSSVSDTQSGSMPSPISVSSLSVATPNVSYTPPDVTVCSTCLHQDSIRRRSPFRRSISM